MQSWLEGRIWELKGAQATGMTASLIIQSSKADSNTWESFTRSELKLESVHQESQRSDIFRKMATKPLLNVTLLNVRSILPGLWRKRTGLLLSGPKSSFQMKVHFAFHLETRSQSLEEEWRGTESMLLEVQCEVSTVSDDLGCHVICWCWPTVFSEVHSHRSHLPGNFRALYASFCWQALWRCWFHFPAGLAHTAKGTKSWFNDHGVTVLDWPANSPDLNPIENLWGIVKRKMRDTRPNNADDLKATVKETWASIPPQQCHKLITSMPRRIEAVIKAKGAPTKYWVHIQ